MVFHQLGQPPSRRMTAKRARCKVLALPLFAPPCKNPSSCATLVADSPAAFAAARRTQACTLASLPRGCRSTQTRCSPTMRRTKKGRASCNNNYSNTLKTSAKKETDTIHHDFWHKKGQCEGIHITLSRHCEQLVVALFFLSLFNTVPLRSLKYNSQRSNWRNRG